MKIQLTGNLSNTTMRVDHPVRGLDPVLRGKRSPRSWHDNILPADPCPAISDVHHSRGTSEIPIWEIKLRVHRGKTPRSCQSPCSGRGFRQYPDRAAGGVVDE